MILNEASGVGRGEILLGFVSHIKEFSLHPLRSGETTEGF